MVSPCVRLPVLGIGIHSSGMQAGCCRQPECTTPAAVFVKDDIGASRTRVRTADPSCDKLIRQSQLNNSYISPQPGTSTSCGPLLWRMEGGWAAVCGGNQGIPKTSFIISVIVLSAKLAQCSRGLLRQGGGRHFEMALLGND